MMHRMFYNIWAVKHKFFVKGNITTTVAVFGASHEAALTPINQIKAFPLERFLANLSNKYVGLFV